MHLFALSLSTVSVPGSDKILYSSNLYDELCGHFSLGNLYFPSEIVFSKIGVCFRVSKNICPKSGCFNMQI